MTARHWLVLLAALTSLPSCAHRSFGVETLVSRYKAIENLEIWQYEYRGSEVYYVPLSRIQCCDAFSELYDLQGELICMPDGGITGRGDGRCRDFIALQEPGRKVWPVTASSQ